MDQRKIRDLMKEQLELVKTEKELKEMIDKINLSLNQLLVEQLQLKANNIIIEPPKTSAKQEPTTTATYTNSLPSINSQQLNLNLSTKIKTLGDEEEDEDDLFGDAILS